MYVHDQHSSQDKADSSSFWDTDMLMEAPPQRKFHITHSGCNCLLMFLILCPLPPLLGQTWAFLILLTFLFLLLALSFSLAKTLSSSHSFHPQWVSRTRERKSRENVSILSLVGINRWHTSIINPLCQEIMQTVVYSSLKQGIRQC